MIIDVVAVHLPQNPPLFKSCVDCFVPSRYLSRHPFVILPQSLTIRAFHKSGSFANVPFIGHHALIRIQLFHQTMPKDGDIRPRASRVGALNPDQVALQDVEADLVP